MKKLQKKLQHYFNALHVFCFLCKLGIPRKPARHIAKSYEFFTRSMLYPERSRTCSYLNFVKGQTFLGRMIRK
ncbi:MAG: hypothetical protein A4E65_02583 [Syntrophorhabdus sp. PtaU1.Bin153]|nr:MAG: hypothetical protein A4E65_02583 [Syntrophorhabdus sp. PtaU1.Bin153]